MEINDLVMGVFIDETVNLFPHGVLDLRLLIFDIMEKSDKNHFEEMKEICIN